MKKKTSVNLKQGLIAHWPFAHDCKDHSGSGLVTRNHRVEIGGGYGRGNSWTAAIFNGKDSCLEVRDHRALKLLSGDFSIAVRLLTDSLTSIGDIASKFDPVTRRGFNLNVVSHVGTTSTQANFRNAHFGIDNGRQDSEWVDCGRPGNCMMLFALVAHQGDLYAGTFEWGATESGHVYRYLGESRWLDCGAPDKSNAVTSFAVFQDNLYCATGRYKISGSAVAPSPNRHPGGIVYRHEGGTNWVSCGRPGKKGDFASCLTVFDGRLYCSHWYHPGVWVYEGGEKWSLAGLEESCLMSLTVYRGRLYGLSLTDAVYVYEGDGRWSCDGRLERSTENYGAATYRGRLYVSTWPQGEVHRTSGDGRWEALGVYRGKNTDMIGYEKETMPLNVYNGKLYCGTLPSADVYRFDEPHSWARVGHLDRTPDAKLRRAWCMCVQNGRLYTGTMPSGRVYSFEAGKMATHDSVFPGGWHHLTAVKEGGFLRLYLDGTPVASSQEFRPADFTATDREPLYIGFGAHDYFNGAMSDLRIYNRALQSSEVVRLADKWG